MWQTLLYRDSLVVDINHSHLILVVLRLMHKVTLLDSQRHSGLKNAFVLHPLSMIVRLMCPCTVMHILLILRVVCE